MKQLIKSILYFISSLRFIPHIVFVELSSNRDMLIAERNVWIKFIKHEEVYNLNNFLWLLHKLPEYRSVLYYRLGQKRSFLLKILAKGMGHLYFTTPSKNIQVGLVIQHGHSSRIGPAIMGKNCQVWHNVTIGSNKSNTVNSRPILGDNIKVSTGAIILGNVRIGNNVIIGAGAVVVKSVPDNCVVVGNPARIIFKEGEKVNIPL